MCVYIYIYIYIERERERERFSQLKKKKVTKSAPFRIFVNFKFLFPVLSRKHISIFKSTMNRKLNHVIRARKD